MQQANTQNDEQVYAEMQRMREEFLKTVNVKIVDNADDASSFNAIISSKGPIVIE